MPAPLFSKPSLYTPKLQTVLRRLDSLINWERKIRTTEMRTDLQRHNRTSVTPAQNLLSRLHNPHHSLSAIHVTGSKGKGSVASLLTVALLQAPFLSTAVGTYASPHVERVNERIRINTRQIPDDDLANALTRVLDTREQQPSLQEATWFDVMTVAAFLSFKRAQAAWAVVEVGMGGRLDSTNVLNAPVAVITNVHLEHSEIIGPTLRDIAYEKAGIISPGADVICGLDEHDPLAHIFIEEARSKTPRANIVFCPPRKGDSIMRHNLIISRAAMRFVAKREGATGISEEDLVPSQILDEALAMLPARQEEFVVLAGQQGDREVCVILDGAHVPQSVTKVLAEVRFPKPPVVVLGVGKEKDVDGICCAVHTIRPQQIFATCAGEDAPYMRPHELAKRLHATGNSPISTWDDAEQALKEAIVEAADAGSSVMVIGSLHLAGRIRPELRFLHEDRRVKLVGKRRRQQGVL